VITVAVVDDDRIFREGLRAWIGLHRPDIQLVAEVAGVDELRGQRQEPPAVVVLDVLLEDGSRLAENIHALQERGSQVVIVTSDDSSAEMRWTALRESALSFLHKNDGFEEILLAVEEAAAGRPYMNSAFAYLLQRKGKKVELTPQQAEALRLYAGGMSTAEVAERMRVRPNTVKTFIKQVRDRYREAQRPAPSRSELVKRAHEDGYLGEW
jgi:DNA-binding NarL/FixJ family response regulator